MVPGSIPGGVTGDFFRGSFRQNHVPWGRLRLWKWVPGISPGVKAAGAYGWRPTTLVVPNVEMIRDLDLPGTPRATLACCGIPRCVKYCGFYFYWQLSDSSAIWKRSDANPSPCWNPLQHITPDLKLTAENYTQHNIFEQLTVFKIIHKKAQKVPELLHEVYNCKLVGLRGKLRHQYLAPHCMENGQ